MRFHPTALKKVRSKNSGSLEHSPSTDWSTNANHQEYLGQMVSVGDPRFGDTPLSTWVNVFAAGFTNRTCIFINRIS